ncbi:hypothetical protein K7432_006113 [Basidiobolus ranarum]|uniref:PAS domain-containing protein n=1 Tax=Basidiobolus ranarum TaxID=34480 RepID=A0ABR2WVH7_9FUNG
MTQEKSFFVFCNEEIDSNFVYVSPSIKRVLGYEPTEWLESTMAAYCHPEELALGRLLSAYLLKKDYLVHGSNLHVLHKNGEFITLEAIISSCYNLRAITFAQIDQDQIGQTKRSRTVDKWFVFKTDGQVTARNLSPNNHALLARLEHELNSGESIQLTPQPRVILALQTGSDPTIMYASCLSETLLGANNEKLIGEKFTTFVHPDQKEYVLSKFSQLQEDPHVAHMSFLFDSNTSWVKLMAVCWSCSDAILVTACHDQNRGHLRHIMDSGSSTSDVDV